MKPAPYFKPAFRWREMFIDMFAFAFGLAALVAVLSLLYIVFGAA
jgi:hypothetical protein